MHTAQFIKLVTVAGWLWVSQGNIARSEQVGLIAQSTACQVNSLTGGDLSTSLMPAKALTGDISISITCPAGATGSLQLTLNPAVVNNGGAKMRFVSSAGVLTGASTTATANPITVPISVGTGSGIVRVDVDGLSDKLLKSATDYQIIVTADFIN